MHAREASLFHAVFCCVSGRLHRGNEPSLHRSAGAEGNRLKTGLQNTGERLHPSVRPRPSSSSSNSQNATVQVAAGVRPSSGAAVWNSQPGWNAFSAFIFEDLVAPKDGRTPLPERLPQNKSRTRTKNTREHPMQTRLGRFLGPIPHHDYLPMSIWTLGSVGGTPIRGILGTLNKWLPRVGGRSTVTIFTWTKK